MTIDPVLLTQKLIQCPSVTPLDAGALDLLEDVLKPLGFKCTRLPFSENGTDDVDNLFARLGTKGPHLCFAGHTDVVPTGDLNDWKHDPFSGTIDNGILYGRGASDMKGGIASFIAAVSQAIPFEGSISLLITGDEEGPAINGTIKMLEWLKENDQVPDVCIVGEPTNFKTIGDMAKVGRRGSLNGHLTINGTQGHVAYPHLANNPCPHLIEILHNLTKVTLDEGNDYFDPSNLEVITIDVGNKASNVIPMTASAKFNIRFNNEHAPDDLKSWIKETCDKQDVPYTLDLNLSGDAFLTPKGQLSDLIQSAIKDVTGQNVDLSTTGGTSDARFIKNYCPVIEFGLVNATIHKVNECASLEDITQLTKVYTAIIENYFSN